MENKTSILTKKNQNSEAVILQHPLPRNQLPNTNVGNVLVSILHWTTPQNYQVFLKTLNTKNSSLMKIFPEERQHSIL